MNGVDIAIIVVLIAYAISGYVQGFVVNLIGTIGLLLAGGAAIMLIPAILGPDRNQSLQTALLALGLVIGAAAIGQAIGTYLGADLRRSLRSPQIKVIDAIGGAGLSIVTVLIASWALGYAVSGTSIPYVSSAARDSRVLAQVDALMPQRATEALRAFNRVLDSNLFPRYLDPFESEKIEAVEAPDKDVLESAAVQRARKSVVKISGVAECGKGVEGSGFVYGRDRVMTNAHVVAGVDEPVVTVGDRNLNGKVVLFDSQLDIAVIAADGLQVPELKFTKAGAAGQKAAILGFPQNGPFDARSARIREQLTLRSPDIYDRGQVFRESFSLRGLVRPGNSGGPLVSPQGEVLGVIFAASLSDDNTGYAITASAAEYNANVGLNVTKRIDTGGCT